LAPLTGFDASLVQSLESALKFLEKATGKKSLTELERDGMIRRYEYLFDLTCHVMHSVLLAITQNKLSPQPEPILQEAYDKDLIEDMEAWSSFLWARRAYAESFTEATAKKIGTIVHRYPAAVHNLLARIKREI
jgi:nucleotidyltransferase substrate binding protein (TIGR01987 family)